MKKLLIALMALSLVLVGVSFAAANGGLVAVTSFQTILARGPLLCKPVLRA